MTGKERVQAALAHKKTDRLPLAYEATTEVTEALAKYFDLDVIEENPGVSAFHAPSVGNKGVGLNQEIALQKLLGVDLVKIACPINSQKTIGNWFGMPLLSQAGSVITGAWGITFREYEYPYGTYVEILDSPLKNEENMDVIMNYPSPDLDLFDYDVLRKIMPKFDGFYRLLNMNGCFDFARFMRGPEQFFVDMALNPEIAEILMDKVNDFAIAYLDRCMETAGEFFDGVYCGDDFGTQRGLSMSPAMWRDMIKPRYKKLVDKVHSYGLTYCHHSCGGVRPIIPDMIEIGFDILNPIQPLALGMEPAELSKEYADQLVFYGAIDEQETLPHGSVDNVRAEVIERSKTLGRLGSYIVAPSHGFQPDTPIENILAVYETVTNRKLAK